MSTDVLISTETFNTAGLDPEGIYRTNIKTMAVKERTVKKEGKNKGNKFNQVEGQIHLVERFGGERAGIMEYPIREFINFFLNGKHLERFRALYVAAFKTVPESAPGVINVADLASALVGNDTVWTTLYWRRDREDNTQVEQVLGWDFSTDPTTLRAPTPFVERDEIFAAQALAKAEADEAAELGEVTDAYGVSA